MGGSLANIRTRWSVFEFAELVPPYATGIAVAQYLEV